MCRIVMMRTQCELHEQKYGWKRETKTGECVRIWGRLHRTANMKGTLRIG